jgi:hypothetical protein
MEEVDQPGEYVVVEELGDVAAREPLGPFAASLVER